MPISIIIIDTEDTLLAEGINAHVDFNVIGVAQSEDESLAILAKYEIDVVLLSTNTSEQNWATICEAIIAQYPTIPVIILGSTNSRQAMKQARLAGTRYFVLSPFYPDELLDMIRDVSQT